MFNTVPELTTFKVINLTMMETGTYNPMYNRPYVSNLDGLTLDTLNRRIENTDTSVVDKNIFSGLGLNLLAPSPQVNEQIMLPNGWDSKRIRFLLVVEYNTRNGTKGYYYFQGFTDFDGITNSGAIAPDMTFFINSFARVGSKLLAGPTGAYETLSVLETGQIINSRIIYDYVDSEVYSMRPFDIFKGMQGNYVTNMDDSVSVTDTRVIVRENELSTRGNNIPNNYLTDVLGNYKKSLEISSIGDNELDIFTNCITNTRQKTLMEIEPLRILANTAGRGDGSIFTMRDLETIDPEISNVINYLRMAPGAITNLHQVGQTEFWNGANYSTLAATIVCNSVPALMMELMLSNISFRATNMDAGGFCNVIIEDVVSMTPGPVVTNLEVFKQRIANEVLMDISYNNEETYAIHVVADIYNETRVSISIGNEPMIEYAMPTFCDSLAAPVLTTDRNNFYTLTNNFEATMNTLVDTISNKLDLPY